MRINKDSIIPWGYVFKVIFPNNKIYVGSDTAQSARLDFFKYFGTPCKAKPEMLSELGTFINGCQTYTIKKEILFSQENVRVGDILYMEQKFIKALDARNPSIGYNR